MTRALYHKNPLNPPHPIVNDLMIVTGLSVPQGLLVNYSVFSPETAYADDLSWIGSIENYSEAMSVPADLYSAAAALRDDATRWTAGLPARTLKDPGILRGRCRPSVEAQRILSGHAALSYVSPLMNFIGGGRSSSKSLVADAVTADELAWWAGKSLGKATDGEKRAAFRDRLTWLAEGSLEAQAWAALRWTGDTEFPLRFIRAIMNTSYFKVLTN